VWIKISYERVLNALASLGLSQTDALVYVCLATRGPQEVVNIAQTLRIQEKQISLSLNELQNRGIVSSAIEQTAIFSALPFEEALELLLQAHLREARDIEQNRDEILSLWYSIVGQRTSS